MFGGPQYAGIGIWRLAVSPASSAIVWAAGIDGIERPLLVRSVDSGTTWDRAFQQPSLPISGAVSGVVPDPVSPRSAVIGFNNFVLSTADGGDTWLPVFTISRPAIVTDLVRDGSRLVAVATEFGDGGATMLGVYMSGPALDAWDAVPTPPEAAGASNLARDGLGNLIVATRSGVWVVGGHGG